MKKILEFKINKTTREKREEIVKNEAGEDVKKEIELSKKVTSTFCLRKPTRSLHDEAELYYGVKLGEGIKAGMVTRAMLAKRFNNDGGVFSEPEIKEIEVHYKDLLDASNDYQRLLIKENKTEEEKAEFEKAKKLTVSIQRTLQRAEMNRESLYDRTAETRAKNKLLVWWTINLCYETVDGKDVLFFKGQDLESRLDDYETISESNDEVRKLALRKFLYYVSFWNSTGASVKEEFDKAIENVEKNSSEEGEFDEVLETLKQENV